MTIAKLSPAIHAFRIARTGSGSRRDRVKNSRITGSQIPLSIRCGQPQATGPPMKPASEKHREATKEAKFPKPISRARENMNQAAKICAPTKKECCNRIEGKPEECRGHKYIGHFSG